MRICGTKVVMLFAVGLTLTAALWFGSARQATAARSEPRIPSLPVVAVLAASSPYATDVVDKLKATHRFVRIDSLGSGCSPAATPSLATFEHYRAVFVFSDCSFSDPVALGDVLADYVDAGGRVVVATFAFLAPGNGVGMDGRLSRDGYLPLTQGSQTSGTEMHLVVDQKSSPLLRGVVAFDGGRSSYHNYPVSLTTGAHLVAHWSGDGAPLVAFKGNVVALNFYPPSSDARPDFWSASTDGVTLMVNALLFSKLVHV